MSEENKAIARQYLEDVWQAENPAAVDNYFAADVVDHSLPPGMPPGREGVKAFIGMMIGAFTDAAITVEDQVAEGDMVVTRWSSQSTHTGDFMGIPATGKRLSVSGIGIDRFEDGKIVEAWNQFDQMGMMQ